MIHSYFESIHYDSWVYSGCNTQNHYLRYHGFVSLVQGGLFPLELNSLLGLLPHQQQSLPLGWLISLAPSLQNNARDDTHHSSSPLPYNNGLLVYTKAYLRPFTCQGFDQDCLANDWLYWGQQPRPKVLCDPQVTKRWKPLAGAGWGISNLKVSSTRLSI